MSSDEEKSIELTALDRTYDTVRRSSTPSNPQQSLQPLAQTAQQSHSLPNDQPQAATQLTPRHIQTTRSLTPTNQRSLTPTTVLSSSGTEQSAISLSGSSDDRREESTPRLRQSVASTSQNITQISTSPNAQTTPTQSVVPTNRNVQNMHPATSNLPNLQAMPSPSTSTNQPTHMGPQPIPTSSGKSGISIQRALSMPAPSGEAVRQEARVGLQRGDVPERTGGAKRINYSQSERLPRERPPLNRSLSKKEIIKNYIKKETANFFGVGENENEEHQRWLERRKRMASRTMGPLKDEYATLTPRPRSQTSSVHVRRRRTASEAAAGVSFSGQLIAGGRPDVLPGEQEDVTDAVDRSGTGLRRKDSVARMTLNGLQYVVTTLTRHRPHARAQQASWSRSFPPGVPQQPVTTDRLPSPEEEAEAFFEKPVPPQPANIEDTVDRPTRSAEVPRYSAAPGISWPRDHDVVLRHNEYRAMIGSSRIETATLDNVLDNSNRRQYGMGIGKFFGHSYRKSVMTDAKIQSQLDDMDDNRPFFTYWVTSVQVLVLLISLICYGFGPFGVDLHARSGQVLVTSLSLQQVDYNEPANFWLGPRAADLIHLGAKFSPCMRVDDKITQEIEKTRKKEKETACCIRNDDSGCVQSSQADCSKTISTWKKWTSGDTGPGGRISGSVCGLDPKYCDAPPSVHPYEWPDDITKWPICRKTNTQVSQSVKREKGGPRDRSAEHMVCEVIGHPCCIGIHGQCQITTREYCDFVRGTFHEEASLCSQVSCLNDVCGMVPFYFPDTPDQFYRLWTSLFLHAGILQLIITVMVQHFLMRDLEKLTGSLRIGIIYIGSGVGGNLASAIFVPYRADVGPAGSQFGLLACLIVEVLNSWKMLKHPNQALCKLLSITTVLFFIGLLPWVDNYAHLFGFMFGFLLSYALLPFVSFGPYDKQKKIFLIWVCLLTALTLFIILVILFYIIPVYDCKVCSYFNCLPLTRDFCASQNINFKRDSTKV